MDISKFVLTHCRCWQIRDTFCEGCCDVNQGRAHVEHDVALGLVIAVSTLDTLRVHLAILVNLG